MQELLDALTPARLLLGAGLLGQALFFGRTLLQWLASERARGVVIPRGYWLMSAAGSSLLLVYALSTGDPVLVLGPLVNLVIYLRNMALSRRETPAPGAAIGSLIPWLVLLVAAAAGSVLFGTRASPLGPVWLAVGLAGQALWILRHVLQWWVSERRGTSVLPESYFLVSALGSTILAVYAFASRDIVFMLAYGLTPLPYLRVVVLGRKARAASPAGEAGAAGREAA